MLSYKNYEIITKKMMGKYINNSKVFNFLCIM